MAEQIIDEVDVSKCSSYHGGWCGKSCLSHCSNLMCEYKFNCLIQKVRRLRAKNSYLRFKNERLYMELDNTSKQAIIQKDDKYDSLINANKVMEDFIGRVIKKKGEKNR